MSDSFSDREKGYEAKWAHDEELRFRVYSRRNRTLGHWAAEQMGMTPAEADAYATQIVTASDEAIFSRIRRDFNARSVKMSDHMIRKQMGDLLASAKAEVEK
jgi:hypothetical protein